jgi:hypothetical protein
MEGDGGASIMDLRVRDGMRQSVFRSYAFPYMDRPNLTVPPTARELQLVALRRISDMQYDLIHDDFQQGETLVLGSDLIGPNFKTDQRIGPKRLCNRDVSSVTSLSNQYTSNPWDVVTRIECVPTPANVGFEPAGEARAPHRSHVGGGTRNVLGWGILYSRHAHHTEIDQLQRSLAFENHVVRFDVAVHDADAVQRRHCSRQLDCNVASWSAGPAAAR